MARLIDAEALLKRLKEIHYMDGIKMRLEVEYAPTIDPVRHGKWEEMRNAYGELEGWIHIDCGREVKGIENYCPNCGVRMDKE